MRVICLILLGIAFEIGFFLNSIIRLLFFLALLSILSGCQSGSVPKQKSQSFIAAPPLPVKKISLKWQQNYGYPEIEKTVIVSSTSLDVPRDRWLIRFVGATKFCTLDATNFQEYFAAYNTTNL